MMSHLHQMLYLKSLIAVVKKSNAGQAGVDQDNLTLHVWCFMYVREATGVSVIRQGRLYRPMMMTMMTTRYDILLFMLAVRGTIKVYFHIHENILCIFCFHVTNILCTTGRKISLW